MKSFIAFLALFQSVTAGTRHLEYVLGGILAVMFIGYLLYSLLRPEKF